MAMMRVLSGLLSLLLLCRCVHPAPSAAVPAQRAELQWQPWTRATFEQAAREKKLLLVSIQAGWCHFCHVMNETTYRDPRVIALLSERFVVVRVDQDSRPDLAERYADWGWPATGLMTPEARTIVNLRGYQPADRFLKLLRELVKELDEGGPLAARTPSLPPPAPGTDLEAARGQALRQLDATYDREQGGWGAPQKYPLAAPIEHALFRVALYGEDERKVWAEQSLRGYAQLIDPVAGGMFQYSLKAVWTAPHYEKIAPIQAGALRAFSHAYRATQKPEWRAGAEAIASYVTTVLRAPSGAFYASQDADVGKPGASGHLLGGQYYALGAAQRAEVLAPARDEHCYANLNGMLIRGLCELAKATDDVRWRDVAITAAESMETLRAQQGYRHEANDDSGVFYLSDQVELAAAFDALSDLTFDPRFRKQSDELLDHVMARFLDSQTGALLAHTPDPNAVGELVQPPTPYGDNSLAARLLLRRAQRSHDERYRELALGILRALSDPARMAEQGRMIGDYLFALETALAPEVMFSVVGPLEDERTRRLAQVARSLYAPNAVVDLSAPEGSHYPYPGEPTVYLCSSTACSSPISDPALLESALSSFVKE